MTIPPFVSTGNTRRKEPLTVFHPSITDTLSQEEAAAVRAAYRDFCRQYGIGVSTPAPTVTDDVGHKSDLSTIEVANRTLHEALFELTPLELHAIKAVFEDTAKIAAQISENTPDAVTRRFKTTPPTPNRVPLSEQLESARAFVTHLKLESRKRVSEFAPIAVELLTRALATIEGHRDILESHEQSIAWTYGARFEASATLRLLRGSTAFIAQLIENARRSPEFCDFSAVARITSPHA